MLDLITAGTLWPPLGGDGTINVLTSLPGNWAATTSATWLSGGSASSVAGHVGLPFTVDANSGAARHGAIRVQGPDGFDRSLGLSQRGGTGILEQKTFVLAPQPPSGRASFPLAMELGIAGKYLAQQIRQAPPEAWPVLIAAAVAAINVLATAAIAGRASLATVPEPPDYFSEDPAPMTTVLILQQAMLLNAYVTEQVLAEGE
jgi:hypothetical protein